MARFDIYKNPGKNQQAIPYLLDVQSNAVSGLATRLVIPLRSLGTLAAILPKDLCPLITVDGEPCFLATAELGAIPASALKTRTGSAHELQFEISAALDRVFGSY